MDPITVITLVAGAVTTVGGYFGGRRISSSQSVAVAEQTVTLLKTQLDLIVEREKAKDVVIQNLTTRIAVLEGLVLQRVDIEDLKSDIRWIKEKLDA